MLSNRLIVGVFLCFLFILILSGDGRLELEAFDFSVPATVFYRKIGRHKYSPLTGLRFEAAAEAIRFVIETLPESVRGSCSIEVDESRYAREAIRDLYDRDDYPLQREK